MRGLKELRAEKVVKLIFRVGFLGFGKITPLAALARRLFQVRHQHGLLLSSALIIDGIAVAQSKVYKTERIVALLRE
jgi:hypothetical protein